MDLRPCILVGALLAGLGPAFGQAIAPARPGSSDIYEACLREVRFARPPQEGLRPEAAATPRPARVVLAIDASGSMAARAGGRPKIEAAREAARAFVAALPPEVEVALVLFGHRGANDAAGKAASCKGVETVGAHAASDRAGIAAAIQRIKAVGWTPLAAAIRQSGEALRASDVPGEQVVWVVSDGLETCGGDPVAEARRLHEGGTRAVVNIVGFDLPRAELEALRAVAAAGGGALVPAGGADELVAVLTRTGNQIRERLAETRAVVARTRNSTAANIAIHRTRQCFYGAMRAEDRRLDDLLEAGRGAGSTDREGARAARSALRERQAGIRRALDAWVAAMEAADLEAGRRIADDLERAVGTRP